MRNTSNWQSDFSRSQTLHAPGRSWRRSRPEIHGHDLQTSRRILQFRHKAHELLRASACDLRACQRKRLIIRWPRWPSSANRSRYQTRISCGVKVPKHRIKGNHESGRLSRSRQVLERIPAGRWGEPADIAGAAAFGVRQQAVTCTDMFWRLMGTGCRDEQRAGLFSVESN